MDGSDDAGVYALDDETALVQTVDFLTPVVDEPRQFGRIAAANALSDVYAMGARPCTALNLVSYPIERLGTAVLGEILQGGLEKIREADAVLLGGHSVEDDELKYGLAVTGLIHPKKIIQNRGLRPGDALVLTKPLGTGIIATAVKAEMAGRQARQAAAQSMARLNRRAAELMAELAVSACTDVTGFGLGGHAFEMIRSTQLSLVVHSARLPCLPEVAKWAEMGLLPAGLHRNRCFVADHVQVEPDVCTHLADLLFDPQTSGGLLIGLPSAQADTLVQRLQEEEIAGVHIGEVIADRKETIYLV